MTKAEQNTLRQRNTAIKKRYERRYVKPFYLALREQKKAVIDAAKQDIHAAYSQISLISPEPLMKEYRRMYYKVVPHEADREYARLSTTKAFGVNIDWLSDITDFLNDYMLDNIVRPMTARTMERMYRSLNTGIATGMSNDEIIKSLEDVDIDKVRARLIARTEATRAAEFASHLGANQHDFKVKRVWISAHDRRTRGAPTPEGVDDKSDHYHMNGMEVQEGELFIDPRNGAKYLYPGDSTNGAQAANVCNCFLPNELTNVRPEDIKKVFRSFYNGKVVTIQLSNERNFTCTPNHPILTTDGWIAAGSLTNESRLIQSSFIKDLGIINNKVNNGPSSFEQLFDASIQLGKVVRKPGVIMDFYGDGSAGNVDIVCMESLLQNRVKTFKGLMGNIFKGPNFTKANFLRFSSKANSAFSLLLSRISHGFISTCNKFQPSFIIRLAHSQIHAFASISGGDSSLFKSGNNTTSSNTKSTGDFLNTHTGIVQGFNHFKSDTHISIIRIAHSDYSGFVYTLETRQGYYDVNSIVAKNCRCSAGYEGVRDADGNLVMK